MKISLIVVRWWIRLVIFRPKLITVWSYFGSFVTVIPMHIYLFTYFYMNYMGKKKYY